MPGFSDLENLGEASYDNALPWLQIKKADYKQLGDIKDLLPQVQTLHNERVTKDKDFQRLVEDAAELERRRKQKAISLNETERRNEREQQLSRIKAREKADGVDTARRGLSGRRTSGQ